jgi:hypothetical protein
MHPQAKAALAAMDEDTFCDEMFSDDRHPAKSARMLTLRANSRTKSQYKLCVHAEILTAERGETNSWCAPCPLAHPRTHACTHARTPACD